MCVFARVRGENRFWCHCAFVAHKTHFRCFMFLTTSITSLAAINTVTLHISIWSIHRITDSWMYHLHWTWLQFPSKKCRCESTDYISNAFNLLPISILSIFFPSHLRLNDTSSQTSYIEASERGRVREREWKKTEIRNSITGFKWNAMQNELDKLMGTFVLRQT